MALETNSSSSPAGPAESAGIPNLSHNQILTILTGLMLGMFVAALSQTIVATALPTIVGELGGQNQLAWVVSASLLATTASTPIWGKLSDVYGRKKLYQAAIWVFIVGSVAAGVAQNMWMLIGARAVQGLGVGGIMALGQAIIGDIVAPRERGRYQGYMGSAFGLATVLGPLTGGIVVEHLSWRWTFYMAVPVAIAALVVTERVLKLSTVPTRCAIDWLGALFVVAAISALLLVLSLGGQEFAWSSRWTYGGILLTVVFLVLAIWQERRAEDPIMPPRLFRNDTFVICGAAGLCVGIAMYGAMIFLPQYLQIVQGKSPMASGLLTLPLMLGMILTMTVTGRIIVKTGRYKIYPLVGLVVLAAGLVLLSRMDVDTTMVQAGIAMFVVGVGIGMSMQVLVLATQNSVKRSDMGVATSGAAFFRSMGGAIGVSMFGALLTHRLVSTIPAWAERLHVPASQLGDVRHSLGTPSDIAKIPDPAHAAVIHGFAEAMQTVFLSAAPFAILGAVVVFFLHEHRLATRVPEDSDSAALPS